ncbi:Tyrosinase [Geodia barretti]|uniref:Tyrosinase n=1 Tax=Geodia barretti TaxID=519541 RepID=A0AA35XE69_GEOBA|nr:Tyrosinase [Geodia barretti]
MLTVEREFQRITKNASFGFPYWQWEQDDKSMFSENYYGVPSNNAGPRVNVSGDIINPNDWNTICDVTYQNRDVTCETAWKPCNPANDLEERRPLQRGGSSAYLPNVVEVMIAIAAPSYDAADDSGQYFRNDSRASFRSRLEGWNMICSAMSCVGFNSDNNHTQNDHMHNVVHDWVGGQMDDVPAAVNDPVFNLHHSNVDRILESWMQRFANGKNSSNLLPAYVPICGGHPGHNRGDYIVPFFPLITAGEQYRVAEEWGYVYDELVPANIKDSDIPDCIDILAENSCPICDANGVCIDCTDQTCPLPNSQPIPLTPDSPDGNNSYATELGLGIGLGIPLIIAIIVIIILLCCVIALKKKSTKEGNGGGYEMTTKT